MDLSSRVASMQPLRQAASEGNFPELKRLCKEKGAKLDEAGPGSGKTALHWGALAGSNEIVSYLLKRQAAVDPLDIDLNTPLNLLIQAPNILLQKKLVIIQTFLAHRADPTRANHRGQTPLMSLIRLRENLPATHYYQLRSLNEVIARIKQDIYLQAHEARQSLRIYPNGQVVAEPKLLNAAVPAISNYLPPLTPSLRYR